ncbi:hypothetical protein A6770_39165 [Nostoc minutum NIES-26]|uniref:Uncharacterized protein n=1 Tax=Nostoc minutum NIES-26 TaxID=1844469 RepID=A0A367RR75_9NOSO|nr:hypothetical protein A6770_39165 [Nostoc minutum NIES-26]
MDMIKDYLRSCCGRRNNTENNTPETDPLIRQSTRNSQETNNPISRMPSNVSRQQTHSSNLLSSTSAYPPEQQAQSSQNSDIERINQLSQDDNVPEHLRNIMTELYEVSKNTDIESQGGGAAYTSRKFKNGTLDKHEVKYHGHVKDEAERVGNLVHELTHRSVVDKFNTDYVNYTNPPENEVEEAKFSSNGERMTNEGKRQDQRKVQSVDNAIRVKLTSLQKLTLEDKNLSKEQKVKVRDKLTYGIQNAHKEFDTVINQISVWLHYWNITPDKSQLAQKLKEIAAQNHMERESRTRIVEAIDEQPNLNWATQKIT